VQASERHSGVGPGAGFQTTACWTILSSSEAMPNEHFKGATHYIVNEDRRHFDKFKSVMGDSLTL
jgi:hypothetical protein